MPDHPIHKGLRLRFFWISILYTIALLITIAMVPVEASTASDITTGLMRARTLDDQDKTRAAESALFALQKQHPDDPQVLCALADHYLGRRGDAKNKAIKYIKKIEAIGCTSPDCLLVQARSLVYMGKEKDPRAMGMLQKLSAIKGDGITPRFRACALYSLAKARYNLKDPRWQTTLMEAAQADPTYPRPYAFLAWHHVNVTKNLAEAETQYRKAAQIVPRNMTYQLHIGECLLKQSKTKQEKDFYLDLIKKMPDEPMPYLQMGSIAGRAYDMAGAERWFHKACEVKPTDYRSWRLYASSLIAQARVEQGLQAARRAVLLAPQEPEAQSILALAEQAADKSQSAEKSLRRSIALEKDTEKNLALQDQLVRTLLINNKNDEAWALATKNLQEHKTSRQARRTMGNTAISFKKWDRGVDMLKSLYLEDPDDTLTENDYMIALSSARRFELAKAVARKITARRQETRYAWYTLFDIATQQGNKADIKEAMAHLKELKLDPNTMIETGFAGIKSGAVKEGNAALSRALIADPDSADLVLNTRDPKDERVPRK